MSKAVYAKIWMSTHNFNARRRYGCLQVGYRLSPWLFVWGVYCVSLVFPALDTEYKKMLSFGIWKKTDVGYNKTAPPPYE
ncbi:conserved Plasmodium protein, unknown function [Plasmodium berghei]|uniref:Uncharacterized protein n=2 Tax=Plasmodium berghei TaxID=5821 RepID=A0A509AHB7_PLABA|nr:conserved protein, unknown function [Plasmodium berghei ANKA]CXI20211.1 conserved Plasmodium protein, unknown function [Plasmodium berghei]SCM19928.1 conserved Plasmodium protein, unknown function [Plasmodium berghei]SCN23636.1 conserved Plasmodium protein, unknown function [Plasmodium berghei]SCO59188.1 conserved Plasmodium protein, unknown function [Plasmodium berghei]SCO60000.1 conserved Plasmodium protein, unknown function [Plasmodium berghei]|eukprot:XP_034420702.1 conserved protein, unknown function [Plasmodium berghei ANKA]